MESQYNMALSSSRFVILLSPGNWKYSHSQRRINPLCQSHNNKQTWKSGKRKSLACNRQIVINSGIQAPQPYTKASRSTSVQEVLHMDLCLVTALCTLWWLGHIKWTWGCVWTLSLTSSPLAGTSLLVCTKNDVLCVLSHCLLF